MNPWRIWLFGTISIISIVFLIGYLYIPEYLEKYGEAALAGEGVFYSLLFGAIIFIINKVIKKSKTAIHN